MSNTNNYWAVNHPDGWAVRREGNDRVTSIHSTQEAAWQEAQQRAREAGGEAYLQNRHGQIRERNTYGHDPESSKG